jgi:hypothetical protein
MFKNVVFLMLFIFMSVLNVFAQSNYRNAFIITNTNDTVYGFIDFRTDASNSKVCRFKERLNEVETEYLPGDIYGYRFVDDGKFYVSKTITIDNESQMVFLEFLVQGIRNLYFHAGDVVKNDSYFFENPDGSMMHIYKKNDEVRDFKLHTDLKYIGKLSYYFRDCLPIVRNSKSIGYDRKSMITITKEYHDRMCDSGESCILYANDYKKKYTKFSAAFYSGFEYNQISVSKFNMPTMHGISPILGATLGLSSPRFFKPLWGEIDINLTRVVGACDFIRSNMKDYYQYKYEATKLNYLFGLKYIIPINENHIYIAARGGRALHFGMKSALKLSYETYSNDIRSIIYENDVFPNYQNNPDDLNLSKTFNNYTFAVGFEKKTIRNNYYTIELAYVSNYQTIDKLTNFQLKLGYKLD